MSACEQRRFEPDEALGQPPPAPGSPAIAHLVVVAYLLLYAGCMLLAAIPFGIPVLPGGVCVFAGQLFGMVAWLRRR